MAKKEPIAKSKRTYLKQSDVPQLTLDEALRIPQTILDNYAGKATTPLYVAKALNIEPTGSQFRALSGAAIAYGLIEGGAQALSITITDLARQILRPKVENSAKRTAILIPRVFGEFLRRYNGSSFPRNDLAINVLEDMGVPRQDAADVLLRIENSAKSVGLIEEIKGKLYVSLQGANIEHEDNEGTPKSDGLLDVALLNEQNEEVEIPEEKPLIASNTSSKNTKKNNLEDELRRRRVFITHGKNRELVDPIKKLLEYGELIPVVSVERQSVSKPVPEKVMDDMRSCGAAIIHVDADVAITDKDGQEHMLLNPNVLIEIGAAMAFYGRRFILLVKEGVKLPSNLQGLYEVRYPNETLDATSTISLLEAIKDIKNYSLPSDVIPTE